MRAVIQRVKMSRVSVNGKTVGRIAEGLLVLLGVGRLDTRREAETLAEKIINLRIFEDEKGKLNRSLLESDAEMMVVSQFTLYGDCRKGRRPSFADAAPSDVAEELYENFVHRVASRGIRVQTGRFGTKMEVSLVNDGPVTLILEV